MNSTDYPMYSYNMELDCSLGLVVLFFNNNSCMQQYSGDNTTACSTGPTGSYPWGATHTKC